MAKAVFNEWPPSRMGQAGADLIALGEKASLEFDANGLRRYVQSPKRSGWKVADGDVDNEGASEVAG
jgi:hypothetical protein